MAKLWIDDKHSPPDDTWLWAKNSYDAFRIIQEHMRTDLITEISFDHDLGEDDTTKPVANYIETLAYYGMYPRIKWDIHSANPPGRDWLKAAMESADKYWSKNECST